MAANRNPGAFARPLKSQEAKSQLALELLLHLYALVGTLIVLRSLLRAIGVNSDLWVGRAVYGLTRPLALPFGLLPGGSFALAGDLTVADATLLAGVVLFPIGVYLAGGRFGKFRS
jgi:hypothetical protein